MTNKSKRVLGRGLGALIGGGQRPAPATARTDAVEGHRYMLCPVGEISPSATQPRKSFEEAALSELSDSIREKGVIEPLIVRRTSGGFELVAGERRWRASKMAGLASVPVVVIDATDEQSLELAIIENVQREDLNAIEEAEAYRGLADKFNLSQEEVARKVGRDRATVANYMRLLKLPPEVKEELVKGAISMGHARAILSVEGHSARTELCRRVITGGLSVREAEALAKKGPASARKKAAPAPEYPEVERELREIFGTRVSLKDRRGKGKVEISFFSADERERVIDLLRSAGGKY
ncbi:MAG: ParB/RepB/Spo0J family partition protein [Thermodesulfobacteriota bacterium]|nr:MAG: ParB/RepB/Spo0J family partition protein [Thermodesulfobacteriota bacterium]